MTGEPMTFPEWLAVVDGELFQVFGRTHDQVDGWPGYDEYTSAEDAAHRMIEHAAIDYGLPGAWGIAWKNRFYHYWKGERLRSASLLCAGSFGS